jgi:uncharacterized membrane protein
MSNRSLALAAGVGALAGLRSMSPAAAISWALHERKAKPNQPLFSFLASETGAYTLPLLALGELVADKTKIVPNRTQPPSLVWRMVSGAVCAAVAARALRMNWKAAAAVGAVAALGASFAGYHLRKQGVKATGLPDAAVALAEDAIVLGAGWALNRALSRR